LLRPQHAGERLALDASLVLAQDRRLQRRVELVGLAQPFGEDRVEVGETGRHRRLGRGRAVAPGRRAAVGRLGRPGTHQAEPDGGRLAGADRQAVVGGRLGADLLRIDRLRAALDHRVVDPILHVRRRIRAAEQPLHVRLVLDEQQLRSAVAHQGVPAELVVIGDDRVLAGPAEHRAWIVAVLAAPGPTVPEPERRQ
jgi:hypothetical protein